MMKAIVKVICLITLYLLCLSCTGGGRGTDILTEAERLIHTRPDSALTLLDSITAPENLSDRDYALYCLLITQAKDKTIKNILLTRLSAMLSSILKNIMTRNI